MPQYLELMEQFKELHKTVEQLRTSGLSTGEMKKVSQTKIHLHSVITYLSVVPLSMVMLYIHVTIVDAKGAFSWSAETGTEEPGN